MRKLLAPVDFSQPSLAAGEYAAAVARKFQAEILFLHVIEATPEWEKKAMEFQGPTGPEPLQGGQFERVNQRLQELARQAAPGVQVETRVLAGDPSLAIVRTAQQEQADLIVMPTYGGGPFRRFLLGSVTAKVLHDSESPVLTTAHLPDVQRSPVAVYRRIACAVDLREQSAKVLRWAADLAAQSKAALTVFHAVPYSEFTGCDVSNVDYIGRKVVLRPTSEFLRECWGATIRGTERELAALIEKTGCAAEKRVEDATVSEAARRVVDQTNADLLVIGRTAHGAGRLRTHAYELIRESPCPVVSV